MTDPRDPSTPHLAFGEPRSTRGRRERLLRQLIDARRRRRSPAHPGSSSRWRDRLRPPGSRVGAR